MLFGKDKWFLCGKRLSCLITPLRAHWIAASRGAVNKHGIEVWPILSVVCAAITIFEGRIPHVYEHLSCKLHLLPDRRRGGRLYCPQRRTARWSHSRGKLPAGFCDPLCAEADDTCFCSAFHGNAESLFPEWCKEPISNTYENRYIVFINAAREPRLFEAAYASPAQLLDEFQSRFRDKGIEMPPDFDWWAHLVQLNGTAFC